ncbi:hypothetical protein PsYK624_124340 [Phanerochaete sordida]|uniref:Uncharacterized protein n=1 Tax=Phanerochaete sordida TaxID=48140 RepID=A0A9P3GMK8_9APHY|nr:hypothetical protein PsYK624_124340 [Phanerochaete sordida]
MDGLSFFTRSLRDHDLSAGTRRPRTPSGAPLGLPSLQASAVNPANAFRVDQLLRRRSEAALKQRPVQESLLALEAGDRTASGSESQVLHTRAAALEAECETLRHSIDAANAKISDLENIRETLTVSLASEKRRAEQNQSAHGRVLASRHEFAQRAVELETIKADLTKELDSQKDRATGLGGLLVSTSRDLERARCEINKLWDVRHGLQTQLKAASETASEQSEKLKKALDDHKADLEKATDRISQLGSLLTTRGKQLADVEKARGNAEAKANETQASLVSIRKNLTLAQNETKAVTTERDELASRAKSLEEANAALETKLAAAILAASTLPSSHSQELFSLHQQLEDSDRLKTAAAHEHAALVSALKSEMDEVRSVAETNGRFHRQARRQLDAEHVRAEEARSHAEELERERARQVKQLQAECAKWQQECAKWQRERGAVADRLDAATANQQALVRNAAAERGVYQSQFEQLKTEHGYCQQQIEALAAQLDGTRAAHDAQATLLRRTEADRDVYQAQARRALSALSAAKHDAAETQQQTRAAAAALATDRDALAVSLADARRLNAQSTAAARTLEARNAALVSELDAAREASREANERTLVGGLVDEDALGVLREALGAYAAAVDDCEAVFGRGGQRLAMSTPVKRAGLGREGPEDLSAGSFFGSALAA